MDTLRFALVMLAACGYSPSPATPDGVVGDDAPAVGDTAGSKCFGTLFEICLSAPPTQEVTLDDQAIDTDGASCADATPAEICAVAGTAIHLTTGHTVTATGTRPLVLVSSGSITIDGRIDVASHNTSVLGAGADAMACANGQAATAGGSGGGGYGGSFGGRGGAGGTQDGGNGGVAPTADTDLIALRGGCAGSPGARNNHGDGGHGGGAVALIAATVTVNGTINASGSGGTGGNANDSGGGGGGSGGLIAIDSPTVTFAVGAVVFANGGGGGEGGSSMTGNSGDDSQSALVIAGGGNGGSMFGGDGGAGSVGGSVDGIKGSNGNATGGGGGGGGGGTGMIVVHPLKTLAGAVSPSPRDFP